MKDYLRRLEEAAKRDHRKIGEDLVLFTFSAEVGRGLPLWMPNGTIIRDELEGWARETERQLGYQRVSTPHLTKDSYAIPDAYDECVTPLTVGSHIPCDAAMMSYPRGSGYKPDGLGPDCETLMAGVTL